MVKNLMTKSAFSNLAGVSVAAVTKATKHGKLKGIMHGEKLDANHPDAVAYLAEKVKQSQETGLDNKYDEVLEWCRLHQRWSVSGIRADCRRGRLATSRWP